MARDSLFVVLAVIAVAVMAVFSVVFIQVPSGYTNRVNCVDSIVTVVQASTFTNGSAGVIMVTASTVTSFATTTNAYVMTGHVTTERFGPFATLLGEVTTLRTCTFEK